MGTEVIFRKFKEGGDIIALFPHIPATESGWECMSYMHTGQHGKADPYIIFNTEPATQSEYMELLEELKSAGYSDLLVRNSFDRTDYEVRKKKAREL